MLTNVRAVRRREIDNSTELLAGGGGGGRENKTYSTARRERVGIQRLGENTVSSIPQLCTAHPPQVSTATSVSAQRLQLLPGASVGTTDSAK